MISFSDRRLAVDEALSLGMMWKIEYLLWLTKSKPQPADCYIRLQPSVLLRPVMMWLILFGALNEEPPYKIRLSKANYLE